MVGIGRTHPLYRPIRYPYNLIRRFNSIASLLAIMFKPPIQPHVGGYRWHGPDSAHQEALVTAWPGTCLASEISCHDLSSIETRQRLRCRKSTQGLQWLPQRWHLLEAMNLHRGSLLSLVTSRQACLLSTE